MIRVERRLSGEAAPRGLNRRTILRVAGWLRGRRLRLRSRGFPRRLRRRHWRSALVRILRLLRVCLWNNRPSIFKALIATELALIDSSAEFIAIAGTGIRM